MKIIGITGGVGAGKSRVLYLLEKEFGAYIVEADLLAKNLMKPGKRVYNKIAENFPEVIPSEGAEIDRMKLASIVYADKSKLKLLNSLVHPAVKDWIREDIEKRRNDKNCKLYIIEAALLIQDGYKEVCDEIWYVRAETEIRVKRLMESRNYSEEKAYSIIKNQPSDEYFIDNSDRVIDNSGDFLQTNEQIAKLYNGLS
jgi:dephospho-CoA kinase